MDFLEELKSKKMEELENLARTDFDCQYCEGKLIHAEEDSLEYFNLYEILTSLNKKRKLIVTRIADLRVQIEIEEKREEKRRLMIQINQNN